MNTEILINKYSQAMFEVAIESKSAEGKSGVLANEINVLSQIFSDKTAIEFYNSPFNTLDHKLLVAKASLEGRCLPEAFNFIITLVQNERIHLVQQINEKFQFLVKNQNGESHGILFSATEVNEAFKLQVQEKLSEALKRKIILKTQIDKSLLSGYKVSIESWTIDDSALFHINKLKENLSSKS